MLVIFWWFRFIQNGFPRNR